MKIAILDNDKAHLLLMKQTLVGANATSVLGEPATCHLFERGEVLFGVLQAGETFDCLLLERRLPDMSGDVILDWLRQYSATYMPVIMVSSLRLEAHIVQSLNAGADDYVCKPFRPLELLARVARLVRQMQQAKASLSPPKAESIGEPMSLSVAGYDFNPIASTVTFDGKTIELTEREYRLSQILFSNLNGLLARADLYQAVWQNSDDGSNRALDTHIYRIRTKLELLPERGFALRAAYGYGYRLEHSAMITTK